MRFVLATFVIVLLSLAVVCVQGQEWDCQTPICEGHKAGYSWAMTHVVTERDCDTSGEHTNSLSFAEGCKSALQMKRDQQLATDLEKIRPWAVPMVQEYLLGKQLAKELRVLPSECEEAYKSVVESKGDELAISFRTGCLEVAQKQAKKVLKERAKQAKEAEKQSKRQAQEETRNATKP
jgi:hypothetical protein